MGSAACNAIFNLQLDNVGKYGTIVYKGAATWSNLCNPTAVGIRVFVNSPTLYGIWDIKGRGEELIIEAVGAANNGIDIVLWGNIPAVINNMAVCDTAGRLMWATNDSVAPSNVVSVFLETEKRSG
jgi:hypothetical protein